MTPGRDGRMAGELQNVPAGLARVLASLTGRAVPSLDDGGQAVLSGLGDAGLLDVAAGWQRLIGWALAGQAAVAAELASRRGWSAEHTAAASELGAHLGVPDGEANKMMARGAGLSTHPEVAEALVAGRIEVVKADLLLFAGKTLTLAQRRAAIDDVLPGAADRSRGWVRDKMNDHARRHLSVVEQARTEREARAVYLDPVDGSTMAWLSAHLPATDAAAVWQSVDTAARALKRAAGSTRTLAQARADALTAILTGRLVVPERPTCTPPATTTTNTTVTAIEGTVTAPEYAAGVPRTTAVGSGCVCGGCLCGATRITVLPVRAQVKVTIAATTLAGLDSHPGHLDGCGPIDADTAATLAADGTWQRLVTDPVTGILLDHSTSTYTPGAALRAAVLDRDRTCCFPQCDRPATGADLDHITPFDHTLDPAHQPAGTPGQTRAGNLQSLCRRHHNAKTHHGWTAHRHPDTGHTVWTAPTGNTYARPATTLGRPAPTSTSTQTGTGAADVTSLHDHTRRLLGRTPTDHPTADTSPTQPTRPDPGNAPPF
ncbi:HNH endonuclease [Antribacter sp. KLBMP9083]|uniref:HNH endonuclease n=2 Tax=Antribacter soli TaxID=2910976 RepID=A0AA41QD43_9MICO|nr:HNH endonuclease [Antribacter soli]